jgi:hypothetical protein
MGHVLFNIHRVAVLFRLLSGLVFGCVILLTLGAFESLVSIHHSVVKNPTAITTITTLARFGEGLRVVPVPREFLLTDYAVLLGLVARHVLFSY